MVNVVATRNIALLLVDRNKNTHECSSNTVSIHFVNKMQKILFYSYNNNDDVYDIMCICEVVLYTFT